MPNNREQAMDEGEAAAFDVLGEVMEHVSRVIRDRVVDSLSLDHTAALASGDIAKVYSMIDMRYVHRSCPKKASRGGSAKPPS